MGNNITTNVFVPGVKVTGLILWAPAGTTPPTDAITELPATFKNLGYITNDWYKLTHSTSGGDNIEGAGGDVIGHTAVTSSDSITFTCAELNMTVAQVACGTANVTGTETSYSVAHKATGGNSGVFVVEELLGANGLRRLVIPSGTSAIDGDEQPKKDTPITTGIKVTMAADANGNSYYEYVNKATA